MTIGDGPRLSDQLIQPLPVHRAGALLVDVDAVRHTRRVLVDPHVKSHGPAGRIGSHDQIHVSGVETVGDSPIGRIERCCLCPHRPFACKAH